MHNTLCVKNTFFGGLNMKIVMDKGAKMPTRAHETDAGLDLYSPVRRVIRAGDRAVIDTGVHVDIPKGYVGMVTSKSCMMANDGITSRGTIDSGYVGSIKAVLFNHSDRDYVVDEWQKITQLVILPIITPDLELVDSLEETERGDGGFGSTGR
jgi:dUTP pyrophosphatase